MTGGTGRGRRWAKLRRGVGGSALAFVMAAGLAACHHSSSGLAKLTVTGQAEVRSGGSASAGHSGDSLQAGDQIAVTTGQAQLRLANGTIDLRTGTQLVIGAIPRLIDGAVLIQPIDGPLEVTAAAGSLIVASGAAQLAVTTAPGTQTSVLVAKVYRATSELDVAGDPATYISAPRQVTVAAGGHAPDAVPLVYRDSDSWDRMFLSAAEAASIELGAAASGFNSQVPANQGTDAAYYQMLVPALQGREDFVSAFDMLKNEGSTGPSPNAKPGDYLIASVIALHAQDGTFSSRLSGALAFAAQGAPWGWVAFDQGITDMGPVVSDVLAAIGRASLPFTTTPPSQIAIGPPPTTTPTTRPARSSPPPTTTTVPANPAPHPTTTTTTTTPPGLITLPVPALGGSLGQILNPLLDPLLQALNNILAGKG